MMEATLTLDECKTRVKRKARWRRTLELDIGSLGRGMGRANAYKTTWRELPSKTKIRG
jgi:hypothetical protein